MTISALGCCPASNPFVRCLAWNPLAHVSVDCPFISMDVPFISRCYCLTYLSCSYEYLTRISSILLFLCSFFRILPCASCYRNFPRQQWMLHKSFHSRKVWSWGTVFGTPTNRSKSWSQARSILGIFSYCLPAFNENDWCVMRYNLWRAAFRWVLWDFPRSQDSLRLPRANKQDYTKYNNYDNYVQV